MKEAEARPVAIKVLADLGEPYGIEESAKSQVEMTKALPTIVRNVLNLPSAICNLQSEIALFDMTGRAVMALRPGANDVRHLARGVYFIREASAQAIHKVVVAR